MNDARQEFWAWFWGGVAGTVVLTPIVYVMVHLFSHTITFWTSVGVAALISFVGIVIIKISDTGSIEL